MTGCCEAQSAVLRSKQPAFDAGPRRRHIWALTRRSGCLIRYGRRRQQRRGSHRHKRTDTVRYVQRMRPQT